MPTGIVEGFAAIAALPDLAPGATGDEVRPVQAFLRRFGYLADATYEDGVLDATTSDALAVYQERNALAPTGEFDSETRNAMTTARCAHPDLVDGVAFSTRCAWDRTALTFAFGPGTADTFGASEFDAVRAAFATWAAASPLTFTEVQTNENPDIQIEWRSANDPDLNMVGGTLAHADFPPACGIVTNTLPKPIHFDDSEHIWAIGAVAGAFDIETVALHEIGHILGLEHTNVSGAVMFPSVGSNLTKRVLQPDDLAGIQHLYPVPTAPPIVGDPVAYHTPSPLSDAARVVYRSTDQHLYELYLTPSQNGDWQYADLIANTGAPLTGALPPNAYFSPSPLSDAGRVVYRGPANHIYELYLTPPQAGGWQYADLTANTGAPKPLSAPHGYFTPAPLYDAARVVYRAAGTGNHIYELYLTPEQAGGWTYADLTDISGAPPAWYAGAAPFGYYTPSPLYDAARVVYRGYDGPLYELYLTPGQDGVWEFADLTALSGAPAPAGAVVGYFTPSPLYDAARVVYCGSDDHVYELYLTPGQDGAWGFADLTALSGAPPAAGAAVGYFTPSPLYDAARVVYRGYNGHVYELYLTPGQNGAWQFADLTALSGAPPAAGTPLGYFTPFPLYDAARVVYRGYDQHVYELYLTPGQNGAWQFADLTSLA
jgi:hypothetical protein